MMKSLKRMMFPMFSFVGDEDSVGGSGDETLDPPAETPVEGNEQTEQKETPVQDNDIADDEFEGLRDLMDPEQFEKINQTRAMNKRMRDKMAKLEGELKAKSSQPAPIPKEKQEAPEQSGEQPTFDPIKWVSDTDKGKTAIAHLQRSGLDDDQIRGIIDLMGITGTRIARNAVDPVASEFRETKYAKALDTFSNDDKYKFGMSKPDIRAAVDSYIRNNYQPEDWNKAEVIKTAYGLALADNPQVFATQSKREIVDSGSIHEKSNGSGGSSTGGVSNSALESFARDRNLGDIKDPVVRKKTLEAYNAFKKYEADRKK